MTFRLFALPALVLASLFVASPAAAGPLQDLAEAVLPGVTDAAWWVELGAVVTAGAAFVTAILPQGTPGGIWDRIRAVLNWVAANWGAAKNQGE